MRRRLLNPFFHDPFFFPIFRAPRIRVQIPFQNIQNTREARNDPHDVFEEFFSNHSLKENERQFFENHFPEKVEKEFDPYKILQLKKEVNEDQIKQAYRQKALKYHPKNDSSEEAKAKFKNVNDAFTMLMNQKNNEGSEGVSFNSLFEDFEKQAQSFFKPQEKRQVGKNGQQYSQSSYMERGNGKNKKKVVVEKSYLKDGKTLRVKREQNYRQDGSCEVTETFDDGKDIKKKTFIQNKEQKKIQN